MIVKTKGLKQSNDSEEIDSEEEEDEVNVDMNEQKSQA